MVGREATASRTRRLLFGVTALVASSLLCFAAAEVIVRSLGFRPYKKPDFDIRIEPGGMYNRRHPTLGYTHLAGRFHVTFPNGDAWVVTHLEDTLRVTRLAKRHGQDDAGERIWLFGDSFVHGWGLDDEETLGWKLQERLPEFDVVNFGVGGYGTMQSLIQYQEALEERLPPKVAVLAYAGFHDERNTRLRRWKKATFSYDKFGPTATPYARLGSDGKLRIGFDDGSYKEFFFLTRSAFLHLVEEAYSSVEDMYYHSHLVSEAIVDEFAKISRDHGVLFIVAGIYQSDPTYQLLAHVSEGGGITGDISADLTVRANRIRFDEHPSGLANDFSSRRLAELIRSTLRDTARHD